MFSVDVGRCHCLSVLEPCKHMQPCKHIQRSHGSSLSFSAVLQAVELSRPLPFRAAPSLHFAMSVSAEEVAKHNKDGDVSQGTRCQFCDVLGWGMQTCSSEDSDCWVIVGDQARNCLEGSQGGEVTSSQLRCWT